jgi:type VI secretion system secreted protein VgrG
MAGKVDRKESPIKLRGGFDADQFECQRAIITEGLSTLTNIRLELFSDSTSIDLSKILGQNVELEIETQAGAKRLFNGAIVSIEEFGLKDGLRQVVVEARPWFWMLTRTLNNRIFQDMTVVQIIEKVFGDHGFSDFKKRLSGTYKPRVYCVQYRESDFDFLCRLMEEEGIYYFFDHDEKKGGAGMLILTDGNSGHSPMSEYADTNYLPDRQGQSRYPDDFIWAFSAEQKIVPGKVELVDFDFVNPKPVTVRANTVLKDKHNHKKYELYDTPGHYGKETSLGDSRKQVRMEAEEARHDRMRGESNLKTLGVGRTFKLTTRPEWKHPEYSGKEFKVVSATHYIQNVSGFTRFRKEPDPAKAALKFPDKATELYSNTFEVMEKSRQFRAPLVTPWPEIAGLHTAIVVGKSGEEIHTDKYGRIKVQFHWDRVGKSDENSSCWVRVVTPWSGKNWGMVAVPRMGQEVVIQFEEGDPDRPICTGMLYNNDTMPPYELPANKTQSGVKTNSSKGGGGFNELMFEDNKDKELVRFQAERDYEQIVKNNATITIGQEKKKDGDLTVTVHNHVTETIKEGNHTFTIEKGDQTFEISKGKQDITIEGNRTETIKTGNHSTTLNTGNHATEIKKGNHDTKVSLGNISVKASAGKITMEAAQSIELKVGGASIKLEPAKITVKAPVIDIKGDGMATLAAPKTDVKGDAMLTLKGGITMIN